MKHYKIILLSFLALSFGSCGKDDALEGNNTPENNGWELVWSDEFNTPTEDNRPDPSKWTYELGASGFGNGVRTKKKMHHIPLTMVKDA